jgi:hypothetical protein
MFARRASRFQIASNFFNCRWINAELMPRSSIAVQLGEIRYFFIFSSGEVQSFGRLGPITIA